MSAPTPGLDRIAEGFRGAPPAARGELSLEVVLGQLARHLDWTRAREIRAAQAASIFPFPAQLYTVTAGVPVPPTTIADTHAPKDGYVWFVSRLSVDGLIAGGGTPVEGSGSVTSPGANAVIGQITLANILPGTYTVYVTVGLTAGAPAAGTDNNNMVLKFGTTLYNLVYPAALGNYPMLPVQITVPQGNANTVVVRSIAAGTVGVQYAAEITMIPTPGDLVQLYRGTALAIGAQAQNRIHTFTAPGSPGPGPDWTPGGRGLPLAHQDTLLLSGANLAAAQLVLSGDVLQLEAGHVPRYLAGLG
jgi:hypothetical protein